MLNRRKFVAQAFGGGVLAALAAKVSFGQDVVLDNADPLVPADAVANAPAYQVFIAPGNVGPGEAAIAKANGLYRWIVGPNTLAVGPAATRVWNFAPGWVIGLTPYGSDFAAVTYNPVTGAVGEFGSATVWLPDGTAGVTTWTAPSSYYWSFATTQEGLKGVKAPKFTKAMQEKIAKLKAENKELEKEFDALTKDVEKKVTEEEKAKEPKPEAKPEEKPAEGTKPEPKAEENS